MPKEYDLVILGGGSGGYVAAIRASRLGMKVAVVEAKKMGGTCLHEGCIPSKSLLRSAEVFVTLKDSETYGITAEHVTYQYEKVQERKQDIVNRLYQGVQHLMRQHDIDVYQGYGRIMGPSIFSPMAGTISVEFDNGDDNEMLVPKNVLLATGSRPKRIPGLHVDGRDVLTSNEALQMTSLPPSIIIIGGGAIGVEWASLFTDFGVQVTILEQAERLLPAEDEEISRELTRRLKSRGAKVITGANVVPDTLHKENEQVVIKVDRGQKTESYSATNILVSIGRTPNTEDIGLHNTDIQVKDGAIEVDEYGRTKESHIYAVGDCIGGMQLAHVASHEGLIAVEHMAGKQPAPLNKRHIPRCTYSSPGVASVGLTEEEAQHLGYEVRSGKFSFKAIGKAMVEGNTDGFVKMVMDGKTEDLLGVHMIGAHVTDLISEAGLAMVLDATPWEISRAIHPHPTLSEIMGEAALAVEGEQIHA